MVTLLQLRIFLMATSKSFQKVAEELYISPSSVTKYISTLETELQNILFIREHNKVTLSEFGRDFLPYANEILKKEEEALRFVGGHVRSIQTISVGIDNLLRSERWDQFYRALILTKNHFTNEYQDWNVQYQFLDFTELRVNLTQRKTDISLVEINNVEIPTTLGPGLGSMELFRKRYLLVIPDAYAKTHYLTGSLQEDLEQVDSIMYINDPAAKRLAIDLTAGFKTFSRLIPLAHWGEVLVRMASGGGAALLPETYREIAALAGGHIYTLPDERLSTSIYAIWHRNKNSAIQQVFLNELHQEFEKDA